MNHYNHPRNDDNTRLKKTPLLFLTGEQRNDVIPKTLMTDSLPEVERIPVRELEVYETRVMGSFERDFQTVVDAGQSYLDNHGNGMMWVVVFSPSGCDAMLRVLSSHQSVNEGSANGRRIFIATIGPTTRDHLRSKYGVEADVCAEKPSQEGVGRGIEEFAKRIKQS